MRSVGLTQGYSSATHENLQRVALWTPREWVLFKMEATQTPPWQSWKSVSVTQSCWHCWGRVEREALTKGIRVLGERGSTLGARQLAEGKGKGHGVEGTVPETAAARQRSPTALPAPCALETSAGPGATLLSTSSGPAVPGPTIKTGKMP